MDRRSFLQATGLTAIATALGRSTTQVFAAEAETEAAAKTLPARADVPIADTWDLSSLFPNDKTWEETFEAWRKKCDGFAAFAGKLAENPQKLAECIEFELDVNRVGERLGVYAMLKTSEDQGNSDYQRMMGRLMQAASQMAQAASFIQPEILAIPSEKLDAFLADPALTPYKLLLTRIERMKPHTLSEKEEKILAMQSEMAAASSQIFRQLNDTDMKFGTVKDAEGKPVELSHGTFMSLLYSTDREVRANAFHAYYKEYTDFDHTLAASLNGSIQGDVYYAKVRNYPSALEAALFPDQVPMAVYDNLIASIHKNLPSLYRYYDLRRRKMNLKDIHFYDTYVPIVAELKSRHTWDEAVDLILKSLKPLGPDYGRLLAEGLNNRWCDRYENRGKRSGAFSAGSFDGNPYILMNFQSDVLDSVFTLAHEAGHSMHSYYSSKNQPYAYYDYSLFVAEVASTFNEQLLSHYLIENAKTKQQRAFLLNRQIDAMRATIYRQTMFAEFEKTAHASVESGEPLTLDRIKEIYHGLLTLYFGPNFTLDPELDIECLRVPHFYRAFYVYKYATGMSAAMALVDRVTTGGPKELDDYLGFLKGGCSKDPLDLLRAAGVDMEKPQQVDAVLAQFGQMVDELDSLI